MIGKLVRLFLLLLVLAVGLAGGAVYWGFTKFHEPGPAAVDNTVMIERGLGVRGIADKLADAGVITDALAELWPARDGMRASRRRPYRSSCAKAR